MARPPTAIRMTITPPIPRELSRVAATRSTRLFMPKPEPTEQPPWRYEGVLHEFLSCGAEPEGGRVMPRERSQKQLPGARIHVGNDSARRRNRGSEHYRQEADLLERALATETDPFLVARYKFYLAQTHLDAGDKEKALAAYRERAALGLWDQEVFISLYRSAGIEADLGFDEDAVIASYLLAHEAFPCLKNGLTYAASFPFDRR